jgi:hypothetical protein
MGRAWLARPVLLGCGLFAACDGAAAADRMPSPPVRSQALPKEVTGPLRASLEQIDVLEKGASDRRTLHEAKASLPLGKMSPQNRRKAEAVLGDLSMFRAMPTVRLDVDHDAYRYLVEHPDVSVSIWRALGVSKCQLWQTGPDTYETDIGDGSTGVIDVLLRSDRDHVVYAEGEFKSPLLVKPIRAVGLLHLRTDYVMRRDGETEVICRGNLYVTFPSQTVETAAKVISPVTNTVIDKNFEEIGLFAHMMSVGMQTQPGWVEDLAGRLDGILERRRSELLQVTAKAFVANRKRELARDGQPVSIDDVAPPVRGMTPEVR